MPRPDFLSPPAQKPSLDPAKQRQTLKSIKKSEKHAFYPGGAKLQ